jgi:hypothetical protein
VNPPMAPPAMAPRGPARHSPVITPVSAPIAIFTLGGLGRGLGSGGYYNTRDKTCSDI